MITFRVQRVREVVHHATPTCRSRDLAENLIIAKLTKKFLASYWTEKLIFEFTKK
jgi:hypothetical protein